MGRAYPFRQPYPVFFDLSSVWGCYREAAGGWLDARCPPILRLASPNLTQVLYNLEEADTCCATEKGGAYLKG